MTDAGKAGGRAGKFGGGGDPGDPRTRRKAQFERTTRDLTGPIKLDKHGRQTVALSPKSGLFINEQGELDFNPAAVGISSQEGDKTFQTTIIGGGGGGSGADGADGTDGAPGIDGKMGPPGFEGDPGEDGDPGPRGPAGTGATGLTGSQGPQGPPGAEGDLGGDGEQGPPGYRGADGVAGATGARGQLGPPIPGDDGEDGDPGPPGGRGLDGAVGATGPTGPRGFAWDGEDGEPGERGPPGPSSPGTPGADGAAGAAGRPGPPGEDGGGGDELWFPPPVRFARDLDYTPGQAIRADDIRITTTLFKKRQMQMLARFGPVTSPAIIDSVGMKVAAMSGNGKSQIIPGTTFCVIRFLADGAVSGTWTYRQYLDLPVPGVAGGGGLLRTGFDAVCLWLIQTGIVHTGIRMWAGLTTGDLGGQFPAALTAVRVCAFRYDTAVDTTSTNWRAVTSNGAGGVQTTDTLVNAAVNATGFRFMILTSVTTITFYINDVLVASHSTSVPDNVDLGHTVSCTTLDALNKRIEWGRSAYMHSEFGL